MKTLLNITILVHPLLWFVLLFTTDTVTLQCKVVFLCYAERPLGTLSRPLLTRGGWSVQALQRWPTVEKIGGVENVQCLLPHLRTKPEQANAIVQLRK